VILEQAAKAAASAAQEPDFRMYAGSAVFLVGLALTVSRWIGRTIKKDLDPNMSGKMRPSMAVQADLVPNATVKEALAKGLVTSQQLATMSPVERQYLFASLAPKLSGATSSAPVLPLKPTAPPAPVNAPQLRTTQAIMTVPGKPMSLPPLTPEQIAALAPPPSAAPVAPAAPPPAAPHLMNAALFGAATMPESEGLKVHCPWCGTKLGLPSSPPHVAFCDQCGAKTAVRTEDQGRIIINSAPPGVARRPIA
jgi:hypothetical protein